MPQRRGTTYSKVMKLGISKLLWLNLKLELRKDFSVPLLRISKSREKVTRCQCISKMKLVNNRIRFLCSSLKDRSRLIRWKSSKDFLFLKMILNQQIGSYRALAYQNWVLILSPHENQGWESCQLRSMEMNKTRTFYR